MPVLNPFLYGKPVPAQRFVGRADALRTVFSRLNNGESTAVVGEPHIGKSSLLSYVANRGVRANWLGARAATCVFTDIDCHMIPHEYTPADFWQQTLAAVPETVIQEVVSRRWETVKANGFGSFAVKRLFDSLNDAGWCVVLLIDEFDVLINHPNFDGEFFGALRSLAISTNAFAVVTASRLAVAEMNRRSLDLGAHGSPFFNNFSEVRLVPLSPDECRGLVASALAPSMVQFTDDDYEYIFALSGRQPFLVQVAASALFDVDVNGKTKGERYQAAGELFYERAAAHFDDVWRNLRPTEQAMLLVLALRDLGGKLGKPVPHLEEFGQMHWREASLGNLQAAGMIDPVADSAAAAGAMAPRSITWRARSRGWVWWVMENIVARARDTNRFDSLLSEYERQGILTDRASEEVRSLAVTIGQGTVKTPSSVRRVLLSSDESPHPKASATPKVFDVVFSYNSADREVVLRIATDLARRGVSVWVDVQQLRPGLPWQGELDTQLRSARAAAVFIGPSGVGPWQNAEQDALLREFMNRNCPVIPVILRECKEIPRLPIFLEGMHRIDCRDDSVDLIEQLNFGITGRPGDSQGQA